MILALVVSLGVAVAVIWLALLLTLMGTKPEIGTVREAARIMPDSERLIHRLATDNDLQRGIRLRLWLLLGYLALPLDLVPDFIPVIGYADDVLITSLVLRSVIKRAGTDKVQSQWPGTPEGLNALARLCRLPIA